MAWTPLLFVHGMRYSLLHVRSAALLISLGLMSACR
jgi:hypothetical protein